VIDYCLRVVRIWVITSGEVVLLQQISAFAARSGGRGW
jgi:hypothetical protein